MGVYRPMTSLLYRAARENASRAARHRLDEPARLSLSMVASLQPASVSPGKFIVAPPRHAILNFRFARHLPTIGIAPCPPACSFHRTAFTPTARSHTVSSPSPIPPAMY